MPFNCHINIQTNAINTLTIDKITLHEVPVDKMTVEKGK